MGVWSCAPGVPGQIVGGEDCLKLKAFKLNAEQKFGSFADFSIWRIQGRRRMSIFIPSAVVASKNAKWRQILTKIELLAVQGHPRSSILVCAYATLYFLLVRQVALVISCTVSEIRRLVG